MFQYHNNIYAWHPDITTRFNDIFKSNSIKRVAMKTKLCTVEMFQYQNNIYAWYAGCPRNYRNSILYLRTSVLGRLRDFQYIFAVIYETLCKLDNRHNSYLHAFLIATPSLSNWSCKSQRVGYKFLVWNQSCRSGRIRLFWSDPNQV